MQTTTAKAIQAAQILINLGAPPEMFQYWLHHWREAEDELRRSGYRWHEKAGMWLKDKAA